MKHNIGIYRRLYPRLLVQVRDLPFTQSRLGLGRGGSTLGPGWLQDHLDLEKKILLYINFIKIYDFYIKNV